MLRALEQIAAKLETTEGTAIGGIAAADAVFKCRSVAFKEGIEMHTPDTRSMTLDPDPDIPGARMGTLSFEMDLYGGDLAGTAPKWGIFLQAAGFAKGGAGPFTYTLDSTWDPNTMASSDHKSLTIEAYIGSAGATAKLRKIIGARASAWALVMRSGKPAFMRATYIGALVDTAEAAPYSSLTYETYSRTAPVFAGAAFSIGGLAASEAIFQECSIDLGIGGGMRSDANSASGYRSAVIASRRPVLTFDPELTIVSQHDFYSVWKAATTGALAAAWGTTPNKLQISAPAAQYVEQDYGERAGVVTKPSRMLLCPSAAGLDDAFVLTANAA